MKSNQDKKALSKLVAAALVGTVGLSVYSADAATEYYAGENAQATGSSNAIGAAAKADNFSNALGTSANADSYSNAIGTSANALGGGIAIGYKAKAESVNNYNGSIAIGRDSKATQGGIAIGQDAKSEGTQTIVIGNKEVKFNNATVVGLGVKTVDLAGTAIGAMTTAGSQATAVGYSATANGANSVALGHGTNTAKDGGIAIGEGAISSESASIAIGQNTENSGSDSVALGSSAAVTKKEGIAVGRLAKANGEYGLALGTSAEVTSDNSIAIGNSANVSGANGLSLGNGAKTTVADGVALGSGSEAKRAAGGYGYIPQSGDKSGFIGRLGGITPNREAVFNAQRDQKLDTSIYKATAGAISVGKDAVKDAAGNITTAAVTRQITNVAAGGQDTDAVNLRQLKDLNIAVGTQLATKLDASAYKYVSINSDEEGNKDNKGATGGNSIAIGPNATATAVSNVAIGENSAAGGQGFATALGSDAKANNTGAVAIGSSANVTGVTGIAMGYEAKATGTNGVALGMSSQATSYGIAIGQAKALSQSAIALGDAANIDNASSYAIGIGDGVAVTKTKQAVVAGVKAQADNSQQVVLLGSQAKAINSGNSVVIGTSATSNSVETVAIGKGTIITDKAASALAIGNSAYIGEIKAVDPGTKPSDTANPGYRNKGTSEEIMTNPLDKSKYYFSTAVGTDAKAFGYQNTAFGAGAEAHNTNSLALGFIAVAKGDFSAAIGRNTNTDGTYATAVGFSADATGESTLALGSRAEANKASGVALGADSITNVDKGVFGFDPSGKNPDLTTFLGANKAAYDTLQTDIAAAQTEVDTARQAVIDLQNSKNGKTTEEIAEIDKNLATAETTLDEKKSALAAKVKESNQMISTWQATAAGVSVGDSETGLTRQINNVAAGTLDTDAVNVAQLKNVTLNVTGDNLKTDSTAIGNVNLATQQLAINGDSNITTTVAKDGQTVNLALSKTVTDKLGAVQYLSVKSTQTANKDNKGATGSNAIAIGPAAQATGTSDIAIGNTVKTSGGWGVAIGSQSETTSQSVGIGYNAKATGGSATVALGASTIASGNVATAIGYGAHSTNEQTIAVGFMANAAGEQATAIGREANASGLVAVALGVGTKADADDSVAIGRNSSVASQGVNSIAIGQKAYIGQKTEQGGTPSEGIPDHSLSVADDDTSSGKPNQEYMNSIAIGNTAKAFGYQNTALGAGAEAHDTNTVAVGVAAKARGNYASAMGKQANANGLEATAIGHWARAYGDNAIAIGSNSITSTLDGTGEVKNGIAIGQQARVASNNSIALGQNSLAFVPTDLKTKAYLSEEEFAAENGVISVGNAEYTVGDAKVAENRRRITNVAGGADDYDAVNVAQLKAAKVEVAAGTNVTVDTDTTAGYTKYTVNSVDTDTKLVNGTALYNNDGTGSITLNTDQNGTKGTVSVTGLQDKYITGVTLQDGTLSITRNDTDTPFTVTNIATKDDVTSAIGDSAWKLGVGVASTAPNSGDATATGTATSIKNGNEVILRADRGVKLNQVGSNIDIGLKYIDMDPSTDIAPDQIVDAKASGHASLAVGQNSVVDGHQGTAVGFSTHAGQYALAAGSKADASGSNSVALGYNTNVTGQGAIGIGNSKAKGSTTEEYLPKVASNFGIAIGDASYVDEKSEYGTVVGPNAVITNSAKGTALGQEATIDKSIEGVALGNAAKIYSSEKGIALGSGVTVDESNNAVIIGNTSQIYKSPDSIAIGTSTAVTNSKYSVGIGNGATVNANSAVALGQNANVGANAGVALGSDSVAKRVAAQGYDPLLNIKGEYYNDKIAAEYGFADRYKELVQILNNSPENTAAYSEAKAEIEKLVTPYVARAGAVSVGKEGYTRQITNVAAGLEDTDAVNVAQLKRLRATGTNYSGDDTTAIHRDLGDELTITGGADVSTAEAKAKLTTGNIGVVANDTTDGLELKLAKDINLTADGSVAFGTAATAPKVDATGLTISDQLKFTTAGISAGDLQISHVAAGEDDTDAVNVSQLKALEKQVGAAGDLTLVDKDGNPLVKDDKGNLYKESDIDENGKPIDGATPVNPEDTTLASDTGKSGLGQDNNDNNEAITPDKAKDLIGGTKGEDGTRGKDGLLDKTGPTLNNIATIKDLQALAQAGLDFAGDDGTEVHRALSQKLT
ncbi:hypothetical protein, partial [Veillonella sp. R32]|uniref:hypothetical protein n=1 Tax=Veillonella sp. R32 TaxID=2021312 RepID=UPI0013893E57